MKQRLPKTLVSSPGGVGTTLLLEFLQQHAPELDANPARGFVNPLKHAVSPPAKPPIERAVFLFGCAYDSLVSLFRRGNAELHYVNVNQLFPAGFRYPERTAWQETVQRFDLRCLPDGQSWVDAAGRPASETAAWDFLTQRRVEREQELARARALVRRVAGRAFRGLDDYLERGIDSFRRYSQLEAWRTCRLPYPVLFVRYETLWLNLPLVFDFLGLRASLLPEFPPRKMRESSYRRLSPRSRERLERLYGRLQAQLLELPDVELWSVQSGAVDLLLNERGAF